MKRLLALTLILVLLLGFGSVVWAKPGVKSDPAPDPQPIVFTIINDPLRTAVGGLYDEDYPKVEWAIEAEGWASGGLNGSFRFIEEVKGDYITFSGSNEGLMTIWTADGTIVIEFKGAAVYGSLDGVWEAKSGTGAYDGIEGGGTMTGIAALDFFYVTFDGSLG